MESPATLKLLLLLLLLLQAWPRSNQQRGRRGWLFRIGNSCNVSQAVVGFGGLSCELCPAMRLFPRPAAAGGWCSYPSVGKSFGRI
jgi:hypothetical protein